MFASIEIENMGPIASTTITIPGASSMVVRGPSQAGKSTIIEAVCFALWGADSQGRPYPVDAIRDGAESCAVTLTTARGATISRSMDRKRGTVRAFGGAEHATEAAFRSALGPLGRAVQVGKRQVPAGLLALVPFAWLPLAQSAGNGREFRDLVVGIGGADLDAIVRGMLDGYTGPIPSLRDAEERRRDARRDADRARGALEALAPVVEDDAPEPPTEGDVSAARAIVEAADAWRAYDVAREAAGSATRTGLDHWRRRRAELGERPDQPEPGALADAEAVYRAAAEARRGVSRDLERVEAHIAQHDGAARDLGESCPTCGRAWTRVSEAHARRSESERAAELSALRGQSGDLSRALQQAESAEYAARQVVTQIRAALDAADRWDGAISVLGEQPPEPAAPVEPGVDRPTTEDEQTARGVLTVASMAAGVAAERQRAAASAGRRREIAEQSAADTDAAADEADRLVDAIRRAPSMALERGIVALGDTGPASIVADGDGVAVLIDGRSWYRASRGRQIVADLHLRLALRRALGMPWLPIAVDDAQSWSGDWPEAGTVWRLVTVDREGMEVAGD